VQLYNASEGKRENHKESKEGKGIKGMNPFNTIFSASDSKSEGGRDNFG